MQLRGVVHKAGNVLRHPVEELGAAAVFGFCLGFVLGALLLLVLHLSNHLPGGGQRTVAPFSEVPGSEAASLAQRFRPWLLFDRSERWQPLNIDSLLDEGKHRFCRAAGNTSCVGISDHAAFNRLVTRSAELGAHLNLAGTDVPQYRGPQKCAPPLLDCGTGSGSAIYYHVTESNSRFYIDYWWFLRDNHFSISTRLCFNKQLQRDQICDEHEGDWEGVTVVTAPDDERHVGYVVYAAHKGAFRYTASALQLKGSTGTRPVVYLANGSHAAYPRACRDKLCFQPAALAASGLINVPEGRYDGQMAWARNGDDKCHPGGLGSCLVSLSDQPWTAWPGQWGDGCEAACGGAGDVNSPQSPGVQGRYQAPWCSIETVGITCDGRLVTCSDWLGPLVQAAACDPPELSKALGSNKAAPAHGLGLVVSGKQIAKPTTPGVIQALGDPFKPGTSFTAIADGPQTEILVRARDKGITVEGRFANLGLASGQRVEVTVSRGANGPTLLAGTHRPVEQRIITAPR